MFLDRYLRSRNYPERDRWWLGDPKRTTTHSMSVFLTIWCMAAERRRSVNHGVRLEFSIRALSSAPHHYSSSHTLHYFARKNPPCVCYGGSLVQTYRHMLHGSSVFVSKTVRVTVWTCPAVVALQNKLPSMDHLWSLVVYKWPLLLPQFDLCRTAVCMSCSKIFHSPTHVFALR